MEEPRPEEQQEPSPAAEEPMEQMHPQPADDATPQEEKKRLNKDEALAEMRRSLREEEAEEKTGLGASMSRLGRRLFKGKPRPAEESPENAPQPDDLVIPDTSEIAPADERLQLAAGEAKTAEAEPAVEGTEDTDFESMVKRRLTSPLLMPDQIEPTVAPPATLVEQIGEVRTTPEAGPEFEPGVEHVIPGVSILTGLHSEEKTGQQDVSALRQEALEGYISEPEPEEEGSRTSLPGRLRRSWRYMPRTERNLLVGAVVIVALALMGAAAYGAVQFTPRPTPAPTRTASIVPIPISVSLPGGWIFPLSVGHVNAGVWTPQGAEWLEGTEVCRIVSLPWTIQLEAVLRTLKGNDEIKLSMSNYDSLLYKVQSIEQVPSNEISKLADNTPCLLVILSKANTDTRWVVTAKP
ncbi:MAG TPA: hypothetical protein VMJ64_06360 [Anaerolineales bacterium]|nr:hypothetical protein [Anaerolineales bacterium]